MACFEKLVPWLRAQRWGLAMQWNTWLSQCMETKWRPENPPWTPLFDI